jgi:acid phosphatase type 7
MDIVNRIWQSFLIFVLFSVPLSAQNIKPYLQSPTPNSVWVTWKTDSDTLSLVTYGEDTLNLQFSAAGTCQILADAGYDSNYFYHSAKLKNLETDHPYYYRVTTGTRSSAIYRFHTQPHTGEKTGVYRILILGDHQMKGNDRYERLMQAAKEKAIEKFGGKIEDHINLIINDGDQVDQGTLDQYEHVHFEQSALLCGNIPVMTTVGNHETYGSIGLPLYYAHYFYDELGYKGIVSPGGENYYSYQQKNLLFIHLSSEHTTAEQKAWVQQIIDSVKTDQSVDWVISIAHRPIQAEQYVGDISVFIRDEIVPILTQTDKSALLITGHHHLYARGQLRDQPMYHMISGAGGWDQYWGESTEKDFDDEQKTIDYWAYQIASFNADTKEMTVESYAIGSPKLGYTLDNILIDSFYRKQNIPPPLRPSIITIPSDSITLPFTFVSSPYATNSNESYNTVWFQVSSHPDFSNPLINRIRDFEDLYGTTGDPDYKPVDVNKGLDIFRFEIAHNKLSDGSYFVRARHRDRNMNWSEWSDPVQFTVKESTGGIPSISTPKTNYQMNEDIPVHYRFGPGNSKDWIGIYSYGDIPGQGPSKDWSYVTGDSGTVYLKVAETGNYFIAFFEDDGYSELAERISVMAITIPVLSLNKAGYAEGEQISIGYIQAPGLPKDWIGIYRLSDLPGSVNSTSWEYTSGTTGNIVFQGLQAGYYFVSYFLEDGYIEAGDRTVFSVGSDLAIVQVDKTTYTQGQPISVTFQNGPGTAADWIGILRVNAPAGTAPLADRQTIEYKTSGSLVFETSPGPGDYYTSLFINNSSTRISNKAGFTVVPLVSGLDENPDENSLILYPSPASGPVSVKLPGTVKGSFSLKITTITGIQVMEKIYDKSPAGETLAIDLKEAAPGMYIFSIQSGDKAYTKKFIIQ